MDIADVCEGTEEDAGAGAGGASAPGVFGQPSAPSGPADTSTANGTGGAAAVNFGK
jgi:hypothetical protein